MLLFHFLWYLLLNTILNLNVAKLINLFFFFKGSPFFVLFEKFFFIKSQTTAVSSLPYPSSKIIGTEKSNFILFILGFFHWAFEGWLRRVFGRDDAKAETPVL